MTSTNDGKDVKSNQTSGPKGKSYYIELYKLLESRLSGDCELSERTNHLCEAWRRIRCLCQQAAPTTHPHLLSWLQRHTARTVLQTEWQSPKSKHEQKRLGEAIDAFIKECESHPGPSREAGPPQWELQLVARGQWFQRILHNPWGHPVLRVLLDPRGEPPADQEVLEWLKDERGVMFVTRLRQLAASKCDDLALSLASAVMDRVRVTAPPPQDEDVPQPVKEKPKDSKPTFEDILKAEAGFTVDVWELLTDIEFVLLHKGDKRSRCIELAKQTPLRNGYQLVERLQSRLETSPREKKLWKNAKEVATLIAQVVIARCMVVPACGGASRTALYCCARSLARLLGPRLPPAARALAAPAATARHLHTLATAVDNQSTEDLKPFVCELYVRAITAGMNELERLKLKTEKAGEARSSEQTLAAWFTQLGALLAASERLRCECTLTAFSVSPTPAIFDRIQQAPPLPPVALDLHEPKQESTSEFGSWASDSRSQTNFVKTSETLNLKRTQHQANVLSTAIFSEGEALGLSPELCQDIAVLLSGPRLKTLSWDTDRELLLENCRTYMERTNNGTRKLTTELKYLNLDPRQFEHLPLEEDDETDIYYGIEKGYEHMVEEYQEPEEIWQDADDPERTDSANESETEIVTSAVRLKRTKKKTQKLPSSDDDCDPLSFVAEAKRIEKKKERPHSKERSKEHKRKSKSKTKDPLEVKEHSSERKKEPKKKEKRGRKKKEPADVKPSSLSSLIGMKVVNAKKPVQEPEVKIPSVSEIDYDSQEKISLNSVASEGSNDVLFDGLFSMEDMKSPEKVGPLRKNEPFPNGTVGVSSPTVPCSDNMGQEASKRMPTVSTANTNHTISPIEYKLNQGKLNTVTDDVKKSISKLIQFRRQKTLSENEQKNPVQPNTSNIQCSVIKTPEPPIPTPSQCSPQPNAQSPKVFINQTQSNQIAELKSEVNSLLHAKAFGIARPVIQFNPRSSNSLINHTPSSGIRFPSPHSVDRRIQDMNKGPYAPKSSNQKPESRLTTVHTSTSKNQEQDNITKKTFDDFLKELQESINAGAVMDSKEYRPKKEVKPIHRVTPVMPIVKAEPKTSPCAKQTKKTDNSLNTFSRLSYLHNKILDLKSKQVVDAIIDYQSKAINHHPNAAAELSRILPESKNTKISPSKTETVISRADKTSFQDNIQSVRKNEKLKGLTPARESLVNMNAIQPTSSKTQIKAEIQSKTSPIVRSRESLLMSNKVSSLTERDQQDLLMLLRQQSKQNLNHPRTKVENVKERIEPSQTVMGSSTLNYSCSSQSNKNRMLDDSNNLHNNMNVKQSTKPSPSIKPSNLNQIRLQNKPINILKTELNPTKTTDQKIQKIEVFSDVEPKSHKPKSSASKSSAGKKSTDWEKVMDAILSHKTPSRGPNALDMALNKDAYNKSLLENLRHQRIVRPNPNTDASKAQSKPASNAVPNTHTCNILRRSNTESVIKSNKSNSTSKEIIKSALNPSTTNTATVLQSNPNVAKQADNVRRQLQTDKRPSQMVKDEVTVLKKPNKYQQFTCPLPKEDDPFISGIRNSDYDLLEELMDDDLRQEIGELSSDDDNYGTPVPCLKTPKGYPNNKPPSHIIHEEKRCVNSSLLNTPIQKKPAPKISCDTKSTFDHAEQIQQSGIGYANPKTVINTDYKNVPNTSSVSTPKVTQNALKTVITIPKTCKTTSYKINPEIKPVSQTNTYAAPVQQQTKLQNVVLIGSDIVYQPCAIQTPVRATNLSQKSYVAYNNQPNMAIYQTTQFAAPVINPLIIGNAITVPMTVTSTNVKNSEPLNTAMPSKPEISAPINHIAKHIDITLNKTVTNNMNETVLKHTDVTPNKTVSNTMNDVRLETKTKADNDSKDDPTSKEKEKFDVNSNKNCERKVLSEVQENHKPSFTEKIEPKPKSQTKIGFDAKKESKDQERLRMKRLAILNRKILHRSDNQPIALTYAPIKKIIIIPNVVQETQAIVVTNIQDKLQLPLLNTNIVTQGGTTIDIEKSKAINNNGNCKENKGNSSCRRILLRSSNKVDKNKIELLKKNPVPRKTKVRLKQVTDSGNTTSDAPNNEVKNKRSAAKKQIPRKTLNRTVKTREENKNKVYKMQTRKNAKVKLLLNKLEQSLEQVMPASVFMAQDEESPKEPKIMSPIESQEPLTDISETNQVLDNHEINTSKSDNECSSPSILLKDDLLDELFKPQSIPLINDSVISQEKSDADASQESANTNLIKTNETAKDILDEVISSTEADKALTNADVVEEIESYVKRLEQEKQATKTTVLDCQDNVLSTKDNGVNAPAPTEESTTKVPSVLSNVPVTETNSTNSKENPVQDTPEIICLDEDDDDANERQTKSSQSAKVNTKIQKVNQQNGKNSSKSDIPQSVKDSIQIEDLSHLNTGDPLKKCVRIKLPSGRSFKATVHGQVDCDIDTLFADPALKSVLMSNISNRQRYTLNIKQVPKINSESNTITGSRIQEISLSKPKINRDMETIDLLSDSDEENATQYFNTEYGKYKVATMQKKLFTDHQTKFNKKCSVKIVRENIHKYLLPKSVHNEETACDLPNIDLPLVQKQSEKSNKCDLITVLDEGKNKSEKVLTKPSPTAKNMLNECPVVEIDDSSNDIDIFESNDLIFSNSNEVNITESKEKEANIEQSKLADAKSVEAVEIVETVHTGDKINELKNNLIKDFGLDTSNDTRTNSNENMKELKNQLIKDLGLTDETTNSVEPTVPIIETSQISTVKAPVDNGSLIKTLKPAECFVNLTKCDKLVTQYENLKLLNQCFIKLVRCDEKSQTIYPCTGLTSQTKLTIDDVTNIPVGLEVMEAQPLSRCGSFSILADYGPDDDDYVFDSQLSDDEEVTCSSPVMAAYGMIASYKDIQSNEKQNLRNVDKACDTEWFLTKKQINMQFTNAPIPLHSNYFNGPDLNENNPEDTELDIVPTLITLTSLFFQKRSIADLQTPAKINHHLKRKSVESNIGSNKIQKTCEDTLQDTDCETDVDKSDDLEELLDSYSKPQIIVNATGSKGLVKSQSSDDFQSEFKMYLKKLSSSQEYYSSSIDEVSTINVENSYEDFSETCVGSSVTQEVNKQTVFDDIDIDHSHADAVNSDSMSKVHTEIKYFEYTEVKHNDDDENLKTDFDLHTTRLEETDSIDQVRNRDIENSPEAGEPTTGSVGQIEMIDEGIKNNDESEIDSMNICRSKCENMCLSDACYMTSEFTDVPVVSISESLCYKISDDIDKTSEETRHHIQSIEEHNKETCATNEGELEEARLKPFPECQPPSKITCEPDDEKITSEYCIDADKTAEATDIDKVNKKDSHNIGDNNVIEEVEEIVPYEKAELPDVDMNITSVECETAEVGYIDSDINNDEKRCCNNDEIHEEVVPSEMTYLLEQNTPIEVPSIINDGSGDSICDTDSIQTEAISSIEQLEFPDIDMEISSEECRETAAEEANFETEIINDQSIGSVLGNTDFHKDIVTPEINDINFTSEKCESIEVANATAEMIEDELSDSLFVNGDIHEEVIPFQKTELQNNVIIASEKCNNICSDDKTTESTDTYTEVNNAKLIGSVCDHGDMHDEAVSSKVTKLQENLKITCEGSGHTCSDASTTEISDTDTRRHTHEGACDNICTDVADEVVVIIDEHRHSICDIDNIHEEVVIDSTDICEEAPNMKNINSNTKDNTSKDNSEHFTETDNENVKTIEADIEISTTVSDIDKITHSEIVLNDTDTEELGDMSLKSKEPHKQETSIITEKLKGQLLDYECLVVDDNTKLSGKSMEDADKEPYIDVSKDTQNNDVTEKQKGKLKDFFDREEDVVVNECDDDPLVIIEVAENVDVGKEIINAAPGNSSELLINGIQYEDEAMTTCLLFPVRSEETISSDNSTVNQMPDDIIQVTQQIGDDGKIEEIEFKLNLPKLTYSRKFTQEDYLERLFFDTKCKRIMKRKADMTEVKIRQKKYRKGKNIDYPKITIATMEDSAYSKEFKRLFDYCSSVKFSYSRPFHKEDIDVQETLTAWPIQGTCVREIPETEKDESLFTDTEIVSTTFHDPTEQTLADEIVATYNESAYSSSDIAETNFNMGFGERSGRVIQNLEDGCGLKFSAATLSDVKQIQPLLLSENYGNCKLEHSMNNFRTKDETVKLKQNIRCIQMKDKIRSFFKKTMDELSCDLIKQDKNDDSYPDLNDLFDTSEFPYGLNSPDWIHPCPLEVIVNVVQVGQLPVSASAQNPVTCDPRVTQVSDASPSQCTAENSLNDDPQSAIKTEYTELTTADLSMPLAQEYVQHIQSMPAPPREAMSYSMGENYPLDTNVKPEIKIELEETPEIKQEVEEHYDIDEPPPLYERNMMNNIDYSYEGNPANAVPVPNSNTEMMYHAMEKQYAPEAFPHLKHQQQHDYQLEQQLLEQHQQQLQQQQIQHLEQQFQQHQLQQQIQQEQENQLQQELNEREKQHIMQQQLQEQENQRLLQHQMQEQEKHHVLHHQIQEQEQQHLLQQHQLQVQEQENQQQLQLQLQEQEKRHMLQQQLQEQEKQQLLLEQLQQQEKQKQQQEQEKQHLLQQQLQQQDQETRLQQQQQEQEKQQILQQEKQQQQQRQQQDKQKLQQQLQEKKKQEKQEKQKHQLQQQHQKQQLMQQQQLDQQQQQLQQKHQQQQLLQKQQQQLQKQQQLQLQKQQKQLQQQQQKKERLLLKQQQSQKQQQQKQKLQQQQQQKQQQQQQQQKQQQQQQQKQQQQQQQQQQQEQQPKPQTQQQNGSTEKPDQIAHAMNAAGITTTTDTISTNRAHALVNILSQKLRQGAVGTAQGTVNTFQKSTSINAMALQQALAQILPPPLNQTNATENNQQASNTQVTPQVLHIVQGKNAAGNQQITLVDNSQQSGLNNQNSTPVLHIVQNKAATTSTTNGTPGSQTNTFSGLSLVDGGLQQGNQLLHIVNTGSQKNSSAGQLLKRVNLLTNLGGGNEQKMVQFVCKSADGKAIQLNGPHQRSMVLRLQPIETPNLQPTQPKQVDSQDLSPTANLSNNVNSKDPANSAEIKSRSIYEENYAKFIQSSSPKTANSEKGTSLPKFNQAFGKQVYQDGSQKNEITNGNSHLSSNGESPDCQPNDNAMNLEQIGQISSPPLLLRKTSAPTTQSQPNLVQQLKQTIAPMNIQTMHGGVIYTRQIPVNIGSGQTINLITVPTTELDDSNTPKQQGEVKFVNQGEIEPSIIKIVPQTQTNSNSDSSTDENNSHVCVSNDNTQPTQTQPVLTQMRIKLPMLSKPPQMVAGTRVVRPSFFQIQRNVISGTNQPVYQQLVLTAAPQLGQQTIRLPQPQTSRPVKTPSESQSSTESMSSSTLEQLREFDLVLEQVKERSTVQPNANSNGSSSSNSSCSTNNALTKLRTPSSDTTDAPASTSTSVAETTRSQPAPHTQHQVLYSIGNTQPLNVTYVNRKVTTPAPTTSFIRSPDSSGIIESSASSSSHNQIPHTVTSETSSTSADPPPAQAKPKSSSKSKSRPKASSNPPNTLKLNNTVTPKPSSQKPLEDEQTTQRILYILAEYKEQVENSPDKDKPAPRRRTNPPLNPGSSKRKKSSSGSRRGREMSPIHGDETCRTMGSEDSSCGTSQGDCNESCLDSHSPEDSPRKVVRKLTFENETVPVPVAQPRPQPQRNVIVADGQTITVARGTAGKPTTAVIMPANYILPVSMVKGGQQIAIVTNRGPKLLTVGGGEGGTTNALLLQRLIGPAGLKPVLTRPGVRHVRLPAAALHNLQAFNLAAAASSQAADGAATTAGISNPPELVETSKNSSPWRERENMKPVRGSTPDASEPWHLQSSDPHDYSYEETVRSDSMDRTVLVVQKKDGHRQHRLTHVSAAALRHKYAILEHELRLQKSLSEECEDLGVDSPSASELFPEAELLFAASPAHDHTQDHGHSHTPQPILSHGISQPELDDQIATDQLLPRSDLHDDRDLGIGLEDVGIVTVSEDGMQATIALDQEEFARSHPNTTFHSEPTDEGEVQPFTITGIKSRQITSTIYHANRGPGTVLMTASQTTVISQATAESSGIQNPVKYTDIDNMINSLPGANVSHQSNNINLSSVLVKDDGLTRFDSILNDNRELHLSNTASAIVHANTTQVIRRVCYDTDKREQENRFLMGETDGLITGADAKMMADDSRDFGDVDDDRSSPERHTELFWESNSASERSESRRPLDFSSDSDKCCKSPLFDETNSTDSSGLGARLRLDSVIKEARAASAASADASSDDAPPLRTYPAKRSLSGKTRAAHAHAAHAHAAHAHAAHAHAAHGHTRPAARSSGRGQVKRGCHCCSGEPAPPRPKKPRQKKPITDFAANSN